MWIAFKIRKLFKLLKGDSQRERSIALIVFPYMTGKYTQNLCKYIYNKHGKKQNSHIAAELHKKVSIWEKHKEKKQLGVKPTKPFKEGQTSVVPYKKDESQYKLITMNLAVFVGAGNVSNTLVQSKVFRLLVNVLDPRYPIPMCVHYPKKWTC